LPDIQAVAAQTCFLIVVRDPLSYIVSAHARQVFRKNGEWDETRIMPHHLGGDFSRLSLAEKIAWHWVAINRYLLDFVEFHNAVAKVVVLRDLVPDPPKWAAFVGTTIKDPGALTRFLEQRPNASATRELPQGYEPGHLEEICHQEWHRAQRLASREVT